MANLSHTATLDVSDYVSGINRMKSETSDFSDSVYRESSKIDESLQKLGTGLAAYFSISSLKDFIDQVIAVRGQFQQLEIGFETMLGSKAKADALMADVVEFATKTPFELEQVASGAKQLIAFGAASNTVVDTLRRLGDVASGLNIPLGDLTYLYGTTMVQGRLYAQDLMQFSNRGIPLIQELAKQFNVSAAEVKDLVSEGKVGFPEVEKAIKSLTDEGGRFFNLTSKNSETLTGLVSNLEDAISNALNEIGEQSEDVLMSSISSIITVIEHYKEIAKVLGLIVTALGTYKAALIATALYQKALVAAGNIKAWLSLARGIRSSRDAMLLFNLACKANPFVLVASLLATATAAFFMFRDSVEETEEELHGVAAAEAAATQQFSEQAAEVDNLTNILHNENASIEDKKDALAKLKSIVPGYLAQLDSEGKLIRDNTEALKEYLVELEKKIRLEAAKDELKKLYAEKRRLEKQQRRELEEWNKTYKNWETTQQSFNEAWRKSQQGGFALFNAWGIAANESDAEDRAFKLNQKAAQNYQKTADKIKAVDRDIADLNNEIFNSASAIETHSEAVDKDADKTSRRTTPKRGGRATSVHDTTADDAAAKYVGTWEEELASNRNKQQIIDVIQQFNKDIAQAEVDALPEGNKKVIAQIRLNYQAQLDEITRQGANLLRIMQDQEYEAWKKQHPDYQKENLQFTPSITELPKKYSDLLEKRRKAADEAYEVENQRVLNTVLDQYQDFNTQREKLESNYNDTVKFLRVNRTEQNAKVIDAAIEEAKRQYNAGLEQINEAQAQAAQKDSEFLKNLFGDYADMGFSKLKELRSQAKQVMDYLSGKNDGSSFTFISKEQLDLISKSTSELDKLKKALLGILNSSKYGDSTWGKIFGGFEEGIDKLNKAKGFEDISAAIGGIAIAAEMAFSETSKMFKAMGKDSVAEVLGGLSQLMGAISNIGQGFAKGGVLGGIAVAVGEAMNFISQAFEASARHKAALKQIMQEAIAQQRAYNLALLEQNLLFEKASTIFGTDYYSKVSNAVTVLSDAIEQLNKELAGTEEQKYKFSIKKLFNSLFGIDDVQAALEELYAGLADIEIKTGHKKTGLFGWGAGKDIYSSILDVYPELISANGEFNRELAETIINTREMSDEDKAALKAMIDLSKQAEEALKELNSYFSDIFGNLGSQMIDSVVEAFKKGESAAESFYKSVSSMLENLAKQMIYSVTIGPLLQQAQDQMLEVMKNQGLTDEQKFEQWTSILNTLINSAVGQQDLANKLLSQFQSMAEQKGFDIFKPDEEDAYSQNYQSSFQSMSQDTADELNGRFTAIQMNTVAILSAVIEIQALLVIQINHLSVIEKNTKALNSIDEHLEKIEQNTSDI